jgi:hypothetical protein
MPELPPVEKCDVQNKDALRAYREKSAIWYQWFRTDEHHAIWPQIYSMLVSDITFRTIAYAADHDKESALHNQLVRQAFTQGYLATQGLAIRRLTDKDRNVVSVPRLLRDVKDNIRLITREVYVAGTGESYDDDFRAQMRFDRISGTRPDRRRRDDRIPIRIIDTIAGWLDIPEIEQVVDWSHKFLAHAADFQRNPVDPSALIPTMEKIAAAQKAIVLVTEAIWAYVLDMPGHMAIIPVYQFSKFWRFDQFVSSEIVDEAAGIWNALEEERNGWTQDVHKRLLP